MHTSTLVITRNNPAPVLLARDEEITCLETPSNQIGFRRNTRPSISEVPLEIGLTVVVYTDGIVHAGSRDGQSMDVATCLQSILDEGNPSAQEIADSLLEHALKLDQNRPVDDTSVMVLRVMEQTDNSKIRRMTVSLPFT
jgi:serine phosphatase RsbU (regulator of sigma subunit)